MSHLLREHAPISTESWARIDEEARERLTPALAARKLVDFAGPKGWQYSATNLGRTVVVKAPFDRVAGQQRRVLPLVEMRTGFTVTRAELADADRGAEDSDFAELDRAAHDLAAAENASVFHGWKAAGIVGIAEASPYKAIALGKDCERYPRHVAMAVEQLLAAGVDGPYGLALGPTPYELVLESSEHAGVLLLDHLRKILGGPLVWSPGVAGGVVVSLRGGDFLFESGEDISVGYLDHDADVVRFYLEESFSFRIATPEAAFALTP
ncbi:MAG TPA: family 1 encapsulin nanocompartment shell protein [Gaiellales bacterium]|jgi:uncharacterized linocin/CFP29 family protein|nr:family 1 encapsulin nanocompartment shell protein [Gaiellales bacterium]